MNTSTSIEKNLSVEELENIKHSIMNKIAEIDKLVEQVNSLYKAVDHSTMGLINAERCIHSYITRGERDWTVEKFLDSNIWKRFFFSSGINELMSKSEIEEFNKKLRDPENFTASRAREYMANSTDIAIDAVNKLIKQTYKAVKTSGYYVSGKVCMRSKKNHNNMKIEKNIRLTDYGIKHSPYFNNWNVEDYTQRYVPIYKDLEKCFFILDGKAPPKYPHTINDRIRNTPKTENRIENEYFELTLYKCGNQKVKFKRMDILEKFNLYGPEGNLLGVDVKVFVDRGR